MENKQQAVHSPPRHSVEASTATTYGIQTADSVAQVSANETAGQLSDHHNEVEGSLVTECSDAERSSRRNSSDLEDGEIR